MYQAPCPALSRTFFLHLHNKLRVEPLEGPTKAEGLVGPQGSSVRGSAKGSALMELLLREMEKIEIGQV